MTASPIAKLVVLIVGAVVLVVVAASVAGSLIRNEPVVADAWDVAKVALGFVGGVLAKTTFDKITDPQPVTVVDQDTPVPVESADDDDLP